MSVFVLDQREKPLMPFSEKRARKLLESGRARVHRMYPFCIRLIDRRVENSVLQALRLSIGPGSKTTGLALCRMQKEEQVDQAGTHVGRVAIRQTGSFNIQPGSGQATVQGISYKHCVITQRADGYGYSRTVSNQLATT